MAEKNLRQRNEISQEYKWDIEAMYPDETQWERDMEECQAI